MMQLAAWWRARTSREQRLIQIAGALILALMLPAFLYTSAASYREDTAAELTRARDVAAQVEQLAEAARAQGDATIAADGSLRERAMAAASSVGLTIAQVEPAGPGRVRVVFENADSLAVYRWIEAVGRAGAFVARSQISRVGETDLVIAEFELAEGP